MEKLRPWTAALGEGRNVDLVSAFQFHRYFSWRIKSTFGSSANKEACNWQFVSNFWIITTMQTYLGIFQSRTRHIHPFNGGDLEREQRDATRLPSDNDCGRTCQLSEHLGAIPYFVHTCNYVWYEGRAQSCRTCFTSHSVSLKLGLSGLRR